MTILTAVLAAFVAAAPARAAGPERDGEAPLRLAGGTILAMSDEDYRDMLKSRPADGGGRWSRLERPAMLNAVYSSLAASRYRAALDGELDPELKAKAQSALSAPTQAGRSIAADALAAAPDPELIQQTGWWSDFSTYVNSDPPHRPRAAAVAAVRGGRKLSTAQDKEIARLLASVEASDTRLAEAALEPAERARTLYETGAAFARIASLAGASGAETAAASSAPAAKELSAKDIYQKDSPSVVLILASNSGANAGGELGTGSVIDASGRVLTNAHVVIDDKTGRPYPVVRVYLKPAKVTGDTKRDLANPIPAAVAKFDRALDLALLELERRPGAAPLALGDDSGVEPGDPVVAIGHPEQGGLWTLTQGVVSTLVANLGGVPGKDAFQTDASINRGNSGGPLIGRSGAIIGVNTSMARKAADGLTITSVNFSVRSSVARKWLGGEPAAAESPETAPEPAAPAAPAPAESLPPPPKTKPAMLTPAKPYSADDVLAQEMKEMEDLGEEMHQEILRRARP